MYEFINTFYIFAAYRMRDAIERKKQKEQEDATFFQFKEESYVKSKKKFEEGCKPFRYCLKYLVTWLEFTYISMLAHTFRLRTDERYAEKAKVLGMSSSKDDAQHGHNQSCNGHSQTQNQSQRDTDGGPRGSGGSPQGVLKGHVRRKGGELKPVRYNCAVRLFEIF